MEPHLALASKKVRSVTWSTHRAAVHGYDGMNIGLSSDALDVSFHPREDVHQLVVGLISGKVQVYDYSDMFDENGKCKPLDQLQGKRKFYKRLWSVRPSHKSCRGVAFNHTGSLIYCIFKDKSIMTLDAKTGDVTAHWPQAHEYVVLLTQFRSFAYSSY